MQIQIISVGKQPVRALQELIAEYEGRLKTYCSLQWVYPPSSKLDGNDARSEESARILREIKPHDTVVLLDERGVSLTNRQLSSKLEGWLGRQGRLVFVIGGAHGVDDALRQRADAVWCLSPLIFPHQIVRLLLAEQLYRSFAILQNHPYHHV